MLVAPLFGAVIGILVLQIKFGGFVLERLVCPGVILFLLLFFPRDPVYLCLEFDLSLMELGNDIDLLINLRDAIFQVTDVNSV